MIEHKSAVFVEDRILFDSYDAFAQVGVAGQEGKVITFINVEYRTHGASIHQIEGITASSLTVPEDGSIDLANIVLASSHREAILESQRTPIYNWIREWVPVEAWNRSNRMVKRLLP